MEIILNWALVISKRLESASQNAFLEILKYAGQLKKSFPSVFKRKPSLAGCPCYVRWNLTMDWMLVFLSLACITGALLAKRGERGILKKNVRNVPEAREEGGEK